MSSKAREQTVQAKEEPERGAGSPDGSGELSRRPAADCSPLRCVMTSLTCQLGSRDLLPN